MRNLLKNLCLKNGVIFYEPLIEVPTVSVDLLPYPEHFAILKT